MFFFFFKNIFFIYLGHWKKFLAPLVLWQTSSSEKGNTQSKGVRLHQDYYPYYQQRNSTFLEGKKIISHGGLQT